MTTRAKLGEIARDQKGSAVASLMITVAAAIVFTSIFLLRSGPEDRPQSAAVVFLFATLPIFGTAPFFHLGARRRLCDVLKIVIPACLLPILPALALVSQILVFAVAAGVVAYWLFWMTRMRVETTRFGVAAALVGGLLLAALGITQIPADRFLIPENAAAGFAHTDALFHVTLAQMIQKYGVVSLGADGLSFQNYHFGSHAVAAGLADLSGMDLLHVYVYWGTAGLFLQVVWSVFLASVLLGNERSLGSDLVAFAFATFAATLIWVPSGESFNVAIACFLGLVVLLARLAGRQSFDQECFPASLAFALVATFLCASVKVSVGFFAALFLSWVALQNRNRPLLLVGCGLGLALIAGATAKFFTDQSHFIPLHMLKVAYLQYFTPQTVLSYGLPIALIASAFLRFRLHAGEATMALVWTRPNLSVRGLARLPERLARAAGVMQMLVLSTLGCVALLFTFPIGSNMAYFSLVLLSISLVGLPAILRTSRRARGFSKLHARVVIAAWIAVIIWSALSYPKDVKAAVGRLSASVLSKDARHPWTVLKQGWIDAGEPLSLIRKQLSATSWSQLTREIQRLDREGRVVVHVKDGNQEFWRRLQGKSAYWCMSAHLMLPAQTGIVQVKSVAPASIEAECSWGALPYYGFGRNQGLHRSSGQSNDALCSEARMLGARRVYLVNSISNLVDNTVLECGS